MTADITSMHPLMQICSDNNLIDLHSLSLDTFLPRRIGFAASEISQSAILFALAK